MVLGVLATAVLQSRTIGVTEPHEGDPAAVKDLDKLGKIGQRARQPVDPTTTSIWPASISAISLFRAGRSIVPPENPPSS
jgi:hypothetical protein